MSCRTERIDWFLQQDEMRILKLSLEVNDSVENEAECVLQKTSCEGEST